MNKQAKKIIAASVLVLAGLGGGAVLSTTGVASAATSSATTSTHRGHEGETALTGSTASKVKAAALDKYPGATIDRLETDSDGVYEAHLVTKAGDDIIVQVGKDFAITGTQTGGGGDHDGDGSGASAE